MSLYLEGIKAEELLDVFQWARIGANNCMIGLGVVATELPDNEDLFDKDVHARKVGEWDMFELITSAYFGKQYYFAEENGMVYSRETHKCMTKEDAISEFLGIIVNERSEMSKRNGKITRTGKLVKYEAEIFSRITRKIRKVSGEVISGDNAAAEIKAALEKDLTADEMICSSRILEVWENLYGLSQEDYYKTAEILESKRIR